MSEREQAEREEYIKSFIDAYIEALKTFSRRGDKDNDRCNINKFRIRKG